MKNVSHFTMRKPEMIRRFGLEILNRLRTNLTHINYIAIRSTLVKLEGEENLITGLIVMPEVCHQVTYHIAFSLKGDTAWKF